MFGYKFIKKNEFEYLTSLRISNVSLVVENQKLNSELDSYEAKVRLLEATIEDLKKEVEESRKNIILLSDVSETPLKEVPKKKNATKTRRRVVRKKETE